MTAGFRSAASSGGSQFTTSASIPVPAGAAAGDVVLAFLTRWSGGGFSAITPPTGFTQVRLLTVGANECSVWSKRLTGADTDPYVFTWGGGQFWNHADAVAVTGALDTGDPLADIATANNSGSTYPDVTVTAPAGGLLVWHGSSQSVGTHTPPTGFTEVTDAETDATAYLAGASGAVTATGATSTASNPNFAVLAAVAPQPSGRTITLTLDESAGGADGIAREARVVLRENAGVTETLRRERTMVLRESAGTSDATAVSNGSRTVRRAVLAAQTRSSAALAAPGRLVAALEGQP